MVQEAQTWAALLRPHVPAHPMDGAVELHLVMVYPHLKRTRPAESSLRIPKVSRPDAGNAAKHLEDILVRMRFLGDDAAVARLIVEKWHGREADVGIYISIQPILVAQGANDANTI